MPENLRTKRLRKLIEPSPHVSTEAVRLARSFATASVRRTVDLGVGALRAIVLKVPSLEKDGFRMYINNSTDPEVDSSTKYQIFQVPTKGQLDAVKLTSTYPSNFAPVKMRDHDYYAYKLGEDGEMLNDNQITAELLNSLPGVVLAVK